MSLEIYGEKIESTTGALKEMAGLIGTPSEEKESGLHAELGMSAESKILLSRAEVDRQGIFDVMVMGTFKNGKSTFLNSMVGTKILPARAVACTAIITLIVYGEQEDTVTVHFRDKREPLKLTVGEFNERYRLSPQQMEIINQGGDLDEFSDIDYAVMETRYPLCRNGVRLVDSPGLEERNSATEITRSYLPQAHAIIFLMDATHIFTEKERQAIQENFLGKQCRNVFFVINKIDMLNTNEDRQTVIDSVRHNISRVFTDEQGVFDETLFSKRVFYTNAYQALEARIAGNNDAFEDSGVAAFERALEEFLLSQDRFQSVMKTSLSLVGKVYTDAEIRMEENISARKRPLKELKKAKEETEAILKEQIKKKGELEKAFNRTSDLVYLKIKDSLARYVDTIENGWDSDVENIEVKGFKIMDFVKSLFNAENRKLAAQPFADAIGKYVTDKMQIWQKQVETEISGDMEELTRETQEFTKNFNLEINKITAHFAGKTGNSETENRFNTLQTLTGLLVGDASLTFLGAAGMYSWKQFLGKILINISITLAALIVIGPVGWVILAIEAFQIWRAGSNLERQILDKVKNKVFFGIREDLKTHNNEIEAIISGAFNKEYEKIDRIITSRIEDIRVNQQMIISDVESGQNHVQELETRYTAIRRRLRELVGVVYENAYDQPMTDEDFGKVTAN